MATWVLSAPARGSKKPFKEGSLRTHRLIWAFCVIPDYSDERCARCSGPHPVPLNTHWTRATFPCPRKKRDRSGRRPGCPSEPPDGHYWLVPRCFCLSSRQTIPTLLDSMPLPIDRG